MTGMTHAIAGACAAIAISAPAGGVVLASLGGLLCDIDCSTSAVGKNFKLISGLFEHRSFTHSLFFAVLCSFVNVWIALGVTTHILLDMMTSSGVRLLWPYKKKLRLPLARLNETNSLFEQILRAVLITTIVVLAAFQTKFGVNQWLDFLRQAVSYIKSLM